MRSPSNSLRGFRVSALAWLVLLSVAALLPLIAFTGFSVDRISERLLAADQQRVRERAEALSASADRQVKNMIALADLFAASPYLMEGNLAEFHRQAQSVVRAQQFNVIVLDTSLQQLLNTRVAFGTPLPNTASPESVQRAIDTKQPTISGVFFGQVSKRMVFNVNVPMLLDGSVRYVVVVTAEPVRIRELLEEQRIRDGWHGAVVDQENHLIATDYSGAAKLTGANLAGVIAADIRESYAIADVGGELSLVSTVRSNLTGWTSIAWVPVAVQYAPINEIWRTLVAASLFAIAASALLAYVFARPFANLIRQVSGVIQKVGTGETLPPLSKFFAETDEISVRLANANEQLLSRERQLLESAADLESSERRLRLALSVAKMAIIDRELTGKMAVRVENGAEVLGLTETEYRAAEWSEAFLSLVHPADRARVEDLRRRSESTPGPFSYDFRIARPGKDTVWIEAKGEAIGDGAPRRVVKTAIDITARKQSEQSLRLVSRELTHRAKNLMTVILGIATQTAKSHDSIEEFMQAYSRRIEGLGRSHDLLMQSNWNGAPLDELAAAQLAAFGGVDGERIRANGPRIVLKNDVLQSLGLAFHELGTNAVKYGALSRSSGRVDISWDIVRANGQERLQLTWSESGGPPVKEAKRKGFGHVITVRSLARVVSGDANITFGKSGVAWTVDAPLEAIVPDTRDTPEQS